MTIFKVDWYEEVLQIIGDVRELADMKFITHPNTRVGRLLDDTPTELTHPFYLEIDTCDLSPVFMYPLEREHVKELARRISSEYACSVNVLAAARVLISYENGVLVKEWSTTDYYNMTEEQAELYRL